MKRIISLLLCSPLLFLACQTDEVSPSITPDKDLTIAMTAVDFDSEMTAKINAFRNSISKNGVLARSEQDLVAYFSSINESLIDYGIQLEKVEYYAMDEAGRTLFFSDRGNKQLNSDYVPNDPRNLVPGTSIPYYVDGTELVTTSGLNTLAPINDVMSTWESVTCSDGLEFLNAGTSGSDIGFVQSLVGFGGLAGFFPGVIVHAGVLSPAFFNAIAPGGGTNILGVCFTFVWEEDINQDGTPDVAIKELYYNDAFNWQDVVATGSGVDFQTVALHEVGHALSQAHFGAVSRTDKNGKLHFSPRALMNAGYSGVNRVVEKTDEAGHCSNWANWPIN
ncbi:MAG: hypothetical protein P8X57_10670 [Cyclobacteriaceae bacterium]